MNPAAISWPSGEKEVYRDLAVAFIYTIVEGRGITQKMPFAGQHTRGDVDPPKGDKIPLKQ